MSPLPAGAPANAEQWRRWNDRRWAAAWPRRERLTSAVTPLLLGAAAIAPGERVLDVGCGGGGTCLEAARAAREVVGVDLSGPLLELARERAAGAGAANVRFLQADIQVERLDGEPFHVAISQFGVMFFDDPVAAFANVAHHLHPGGRLAFACWQPAERNPWHAGRVLAPFAGPPPPDPAAGAAAGPFAFGEPALVAGILAAAGFGGVACTAHQIEVEAPGHAVFADDDLEALDPSVREAARDAGRAHVARFAHPDGGDRCRFPLALHVVTAHLA